MCNECLTGLSTLSIKVESVQELNLESLIYNFIL